MTRKTLLFMAGVAVALSTLALAAPAAAALGLIFSRMTAAPGDVVAVETRGRGALAQLREAGGLARAPRLFLVRNSSVGQVRSPGDSRLIALGVLTIDRKGNGRGRLTIPNVRAGDYAVLMDCPACAPHSPGSELLPVGPFPAPLRVTDASPVVRDCSTSQAGPLPADWEETSGVRAGPVAFYFFAPRSSVEARSFAAVSGRRGYYRPFKVLAVVDNSAGAVTVSVPEALRGRFALWYRRNPGGGDPARGAVRVVDGQSAVSFQPCADTDVAQTQFGGGFVVAGSQCAGLEVRLEGRSEPFAAELPFGRRC